MPGPKALSPSPTLVVVGSSIFLLIMYYIAKIFYPYRFFFLKKQMDSKLLIILHVFFLAKLKKQKHDTVFHIVFDIYSKYVIAPSNYSNSSLSISYIISHILCSSIVYCILIRSVWPSYAYHSCVILILGAIVAWFF